ncbi:hypothetical protein NDU88_005025 [Pleurodeles waltl]|uniref:Uncharacterized protein n=1 Tax=Pleurodeles waltl TaxID=8319 RepID=A0AAV7NL91_PLEWA|nr:hypothetical protein NDU88_005025 [Pleurodeles waltl]
MTGVQTKDPKDHSIKALLGSSHQTAEFALQLAGGDNPWQLFGGGPDFLATSGDIQTMMTAFTNEMILLGQNFDKSLSELDHVVPRLDSCVNHLEVANVEGALKRSEITMLVAEL